MVRVLLDPLARFILSEHLNMEHLGQNTPIIITFSWAHILDIQLAAYQISERK